MRDHARNMKRNVKLCNRLFHGITIKQPLPCSQSVRALSLEPLEDRWMLAVQFSDQLIIAQSEISAPSEVHAADLDADGDMDVVAETSGKTVWYENLDGRGAFGRAKAIGERGIASARVTDLDGDGDLDLLAARRDTESIVWYENTTGWATLGAEKAIATELDWPGALGTIDVDRDGDLDIMATLVIPFWGGLIGPPGQVVWFENLDGNTSFGPKQVIAGPLEIAGFYAADMDGDQDVDVLATSNCGDCPGGTIRLYENVDGKGTFALQQTIATGGMSSLYTTDLDRDGDVDVLTTSSWDQNVEWYQNGEENNAAPPGEEGGSFSSAQVLISNAAARSFHMADVDADGDLDLLTPGRDRISWYENTDGRGQFGQPRTINSAVSEASSIYAADIDGDGDLDVLFASWRDDNVAWHENLDGRGTFGPQQIITSTTSAGSRSVYAADLDGDGDTDVLGASYGDDKIAWYENVNGQGTFAPQKVITTSADAAQFVFAADLDGDGDKDVLSASSYDGKIAWYENEGGRGAFDRQTVITSP